MEPTSNPLIRECNTCTHYVQEQPLNDAPSHCWDCSSSISLIHWEPTETKRTPKLSPEEYASLHNADEVVTLEDNPLDTQIGGGHYKNLVIQPMEYSMKNKLNACQHTVIKYVTRFRDKGGIEDLNKAKHAIDLLIKFEYGGAV